jgi:hypothetical protein
VHVQAAGTILSIAIITTTTRVPLPSSPPPPHLLETKHRVEGGCVRPSNPREPAGRLLQAAVQLLGPAVGEGSGLIRFMAGGTMEPPPELIPIIGPLCSCRGCCGGDSPVPDRGHEHVRRVGLAGVLQHGERVPLGRADPRQAYHHVAGAVVAEARRVAEAHLRGGGAPTRTGTHAHVRAEPPSCVCACVRACVHLCIKASVQYTSCRPRRPLGGGARSDACAHPPAPHSRYA